MEFLGPDDGKILRKTWDLGLHAEQQLWAGTGTNHRRRLLCCLPSFPHACHGGLYPLPGVGDVREDRTKTIC